jgi:hypothetical protein
LADKDTLSLAETDELKAKLREAAEAWES